MAVWSFYFLIMLSESTQRMLWLHALNYPTLMTITKPSFVKHTPSTQLSTLALKQRNKMLDCFFTLKLWYNVVLLMWIIGNSALVNPLVISSHLCDLQHDGGGRFIKTTTKEWIWKKEEPPQVHSCTVDRCTTEGTILHSPPLDPLSYLPMNTNKAVQH